MAGIRKVRTTVAAAQGRTGNQPDDSAMTPRPPVDVAILAFPEATASVVWGVYDLLLGAGRDWGLIFDGAPGPQLFAPRVVSARGEPMRVANGVLLAPHGALADAANAAVVVVPEIFLPPDEMTDGRFAVETAWLRERYAAGATIATVCSGAMMLAEAGLLAGQDATTHWAFCDVLGRYPGVRVRAQRALVTSGEGQRLVMAGGGTTWLDVGLWLIARFASVEEAMRVARLNLIDWHASGQQPFARLARSRQVNDAVIARCQAWIAEHYRQPAPVAAMVKLSGLPERSFKRRFQQATGMAPLAYVHTLRLEEAKQMLEATDDPVEAIAAEVGYEDAGFFARLFKRHVDLTPAQYRRRFGGLRRALPAPAG
jgi:transcriptional regulator GlxA family with amidase domain